MKASRKPAPSSLAHLGGLETQQASGKQQQALDAEYLCGSRKSVRLDVSWPGERSRTTRNMGAPNYLSVCVFKQNGKGKLKLRIKRKKKKAEEFKNLRRVAKAEERTLNISRCCSSSCALEQGVLDPEMLAMLRGWKLKELVGSDRWTPSFHRHKVPLSFCNSKFFKRLI